MSTILGIDLGTTNSVVAVLDGTEARVLLNEEGQRITPSVVHFGSDGEVVAGVIARRQLLTEPERTVASVKRFMGRRFEEVKDLAPQVAWELCSADNGDAALRIDGTRHAPAEVSAHILRKLRRAAEQALGEEITEAVITVPAYFDDAQRQATRQAGKLAGLDVRRIVNEPTAAALAYGIQQKGDESTVAVFDFGGGTFDISILDICADVIEVRSTAGDTRLGGDDIDQRVVEHLARTFEESSGVDVRSNRLVMQRLRDAAERAKIELSTAKSTEIHLPFLASGDGGPHHLKTSLTRNAFETMIGDIVGRTIACCERALQDAGLQPNEVQTVLLVGGSTRIPLVGERVEALFGRKPDRSLNPDEVVAVGAALQGGVLGGADLDLLLLDVTPLSLGVETRGGLFTRLIERNTTIPTRASKVFSTAADNQRSVEIHVLQGERGLAAENRSLGRFELTELPALRRGEGRIEVSFDIDANGIVSVRATERTTGKESKIVIRDAGGLREDEVERIVAQAEAARADDERQRTRIERRATLTSLVDRLQSVDREALALSEETCTRMDEAIEAAAEAMRGEEIATDVFDAANNLLLAAAAEIEDARIAAGARARQAAADAAAAGEGAAEAEAVLDDAGTTAGEGAAAPSDEDSREAAPAASGAAADADAEESPDAESKKSASS